MMLSPLLTVHLLAGLTACLPQQETRNQDLDTFFPALPLILSPFSASVVPVMWG